ncbi:putative reverse transcriptase domain-containing protein [Tanacetum coccineum]
MAPKQATRSTPVTTTPALTATTTTSVTNTQLQAMIDQGVTAALAACDANRNGDDSHTSGMGGRRLKALFKKCTYPLYKCKTLYFKGTEGSCLRLISMVQKDGDHFPHKANCSCGKSDNFSTELLALLSSKPKTMQEAVEMATELMDKKVSTIAERQAENKRKFENTSQNNQNQQQQNKRQNTGRAYTAGTGEKKPYGGSKPLCAKCTITTDGNANNANNQRGTVTGQKPTCFECGVQGHFKRECPKLKNNKNRGNQVGNDRAPAKVYVVGHAGTNPDSNIVTGKGSFLNNRYASIVFDIGADRSFRCVYYTNCI